MTAHTAGAGGTLDVIVTGGTLSDPAAGRSGRFDLGLRGGRVAAAAPSLPRESAPRRIDAVTANPAKMLGMEDEIGTLEPGREADSSVLEAPTGRFRLSDDRGEEVVAERLVVPAGA